MDIALTKIRERNLAAIVYTTNSHMGADTFVLEGSYNQFCKKNTLSQDGVDRDSMVRFLVNERHWLPDIANTIQLPEDGATNPEEGKGYNLTHAPMPKFRIVFPLAEPFVIAQQTISQVDALDLWKRKLLGLAETLALPIDISCTDPLRLLSKTPTPPPPPRPADTDRAAPAPIAADGPCRAAGAWRRH